MLLQLQGLEQQLAGSLTSGGGSAGSWSQMHSSVALPHRMSQLRGQDGPRLQKLQDAMLDLFWSQFHAGKSSGPGTVHIACSKYIGDYHQLNSITLGEISYLTSKYDNVLTYELRMLGYSFYIQGGAMTVAIMT